MPQFSKDHIFILPHAEQYRQFFHVTITQVLDCLNTPELHEGLATDHFTAEKPITTGRLHVYYYLTYPLDATDTKEYAIIDFIGCTGQEDKPAPTSKN